MRYNTQNKSAFTLIEIIIAMTIFGIIMVSVLSIFLFSSQMSTRVEMNRVMQENIKNVTEDIAESIRKSPLKGIGNSIDGSCSSVSLEGDGMKLCLESGVEYTLGYADGNNWNPYVSTSNCEDILSDNCHVLKRDTSSGDYYPLTNSFSHIENISFYISNEEIPKVSIQMSVRPSSKKGLAIEIVENGITHIQTTLSQRLITTQ